MVDSCILELMVSQVFRSAWSRAWQCFFGELENNPWADMLSIHNSITMEEVHWYLTETCWLFTRATWWPKWSCLCQWWVIMILKQVIQCQGWQKLLRPFIIHKIPHRFQLTCVPEWRSVIQVFIWINTCYLIKLKEKSCSNAWSKGQCEYQCPFKFDWLVNAMDTWLSV